MGKSKMNPKHSKDEGTYEFQISQLVLSFYKKYAAYIRVRYDRAEYQRIFLFLN